MCRDKHCQELGESSSWGHSGLRLSIMIVTGLITFRKMVRGLRLVQEFVAAINSSYRKNSGDYLKCPFSCKMSFTVSVDSISSLSNQSLWNMCRLYGCQMYAFSGYFWSGCNGYWLILNVRNGDFRLREETHNLLRLYTSSNRKMWFLCLSSYMCFLSWMH